MKILVAIAFSVIFLFSCQKEKEQKKLMHRWKYISVTDPVYFFPNTYWSFNDSKVYVMHEDTATLVIDTMLWGDYYLKNNMIVITGPHTTMVGGEYLKGNFQVMKLDDNQLILARREDGDGLIYHEFVKVD